MSHPKGVGGGHFPTNFCSKLQFRIRTSLLALLKSPSLFTERQSLAMNTVEYSIVSFVHLGERQDQQETVWLCAVLSCHSLTRPPTWLSISFFLCSVIKPLV